MNWFVLECKVQLERIDVKSPMNQGFFVWFERQGTVRKDRCKKFDVPKLLCLVLKGKVQSERIDVKSSMYQGFFFWFERQGTVRKDRCKKFNVPRLLCLV